MRQYLDLSHKLDSFMSPPHSPVSKKEMLQVWLLTCWFVLTLHGWAQEPETPDPRQATSSPTRNLAQFLSLRPGAHCLS